jgi:uncharacterized membrane protein YbhN (UPF0104 family)
VLGGLALATGVLSGSPTLLLGLIPASVGLLAIALGLAAGWAAGAVAGRTERQRLERALRVIAEGVGEAVSLLRSRNLAIFAGAAGYMLFDVAMLAICFTAFGNDVPPAGVLLLAYIIGLLGGLIPIPGGIGGVDAGLIGTLVVYGVDATDAAVAVIAYRGLSALDPGRARSARAGDPAPACSASSTTSWPAPRPGGRSSRARARPGPEARSATRRLSAVTIAFGY